MNRASCDAFLIQSTANTAHARKTDRHVLDTNVRDDYFLFQPGSPLMPRKPWEIPIEYTDSRWDDSHANATPAYTDDDQEERLERDIDELLNRPTRTEEAGQLKVGTTDHTPISYNRGPHSNDLDIDDIDFEIPADHPRPEAGALFGLIDDEDLLDAPDDEDEFADSY